MSSSMIRLRLKRGSWEIELECTEDKVTEVIQKVLAGLDVQKEGEKESTGVTCKTLMEQMWKETWFSRSRSLAEVDEELERRGYHYDRTAVSHVLADLVREGLLSREGSARNYRYVQKKPPELGP
ncbi:MAG: hypothetical protein QXR69_03210 [Conexivisphaerales archaeon]